MFSTLMVFLIPAKFFRIEFLLNIRAIGTMIRCAEFIGYLSNS
jgi:hypothetical protein